MKYGANYDRMPEPVNQEIGQEDLEIADEFAGALIATDNAFQMKREVSEV